MFTGILSLLSVSGALPSQLPFPHFLVEQEELTASFLTLPEKFLPHVSDSFAFIELRNLQCPKILSTRFSSLS